jgi:hypothetical protein
MRPTLLPAALLLLAIAGFLITIDRTPIVWPDETIYASIARAMQLRGDGLPTVLDGAPAVDHVGFYGPVYFTLAAALFDLCGFSITAFRFLGVVGALLAALGAAIIVRATGHGAKRQWWAAALVLLAPEMGGAATSGRMDALAVGLSMMAVAVYAHGRATARRPIVGGMMSGLLLAAAALTVPRTFPLVGTVIVVGLVIEWKAALQSRLYGSRLYEWLAAAITLGAIVALWAMVSHGSPVAWVRFHLYLAARQTSDIALAAGAVREWSATPWQLITFVAASGGLVLAWAWRAQAGSLRDPALLEPRDPAPQTATRFVVAVAVVNAGLMIALQNLTFALASYFTIPLLAAALAALPQAGRTSRVNANADARLQAAAVALFGTLVTADLVVRTAKYFRLATVWQASSPAPLELFVRTHVPAGSEVYGPDFFYFYAVERAGSRYLAASRESAAEWTRLVTPLSGRDATSPAAHASHRYLIWPVDSSLVGQPPAAFNCAGRRDIAHYEPPQGWRENGRDPLGGLLRVTEGLPRTYPQSVLMQLPSGCLTS